MSTPRTMTAEETAALVRVRRRTAALAFVGVAIHGVIALVVVAEIIVDEPGRRGAAVGLLVMAVVAAVLMYVGTRVLLGARLWSPIWIAVALSPAVAGFFWVL